MSEGTNLFEVFFDSTVYLELKNSIYNYRLRKHSVLKHFKSAEGLSLEIGSGISPMIAGTDAVVHTDLSFSALQLLRRKNPKGCYVVADAMCLPFRERAFQSLICSEVLEHLVDDGRCIRESARVMRPAGRLILTFPHRRIYYANDDRFVGHFRRYELREMRQRLDSAGFRIRHVEKVLGPLEKVTMMTAIGCIGWIQKRTRPGLARFGARSLPGWVRRLFDMINRAYGILVWLNARTMPQSAAAGLLVVAESGSVELRVKPKGDASDEAGR